MLRHDVAVADAPIVLEAHQADAALARQPRRFGEGQLALRLSESRFENAMHGLGVAAARGFAAKLRRAQRFHVNVANTGVGQACREDVLRETGAA